MFSYFFFLVLFPPKTSKCFCKNIHRSNFLTAFFCHRCACDFNKSFLCVQFSFFFLLFQKLFSISQCNFAFVVFRNVVCGKHKFQRWGLCPLQPGWPRFSVRFTQLCHVALCSMPAALRVLLFVSAARYRAPASPQCTVVAW